MRVERSGFCLEMAASWNSKSFGVVGEDGQSLWRRFFFQVVGSDVDWEKGVGCVRRRISIGRGILELKGIEVGKSVNGKAQ